MVSEPAVEFKRYTGVTNEGGGGDFPIPQIDDGQWVAEVVGVGQGVYNSNVNGVLIPTAKYWIDWAFDDWFQLDEDGQLTEERVTLRDFVRIPEGLNQDPPYLDDRATVSKRMRAMGFTVPCDVYPPDWIGCRAQVVVEHYIVNKEGPQKGKRRPAVKDVYPLPSAPPQRQQAQQRQASPAADDMVDPESLPWDGEGENTTLPPTAAHQALLKALNDAYGSKVSGKMLFLEENDAEGADVLQAVCSLHDNKAKTLAVKLRQGGTAGPS